MLETTRSLSNQIIECKKNLWRIPLCAFILGSSLGMFTIVTEWSYKGLLVGLSILVLFGIGAVIALLLELRQTLRLRKRLALWRDVEDDKYKHMLQIKKMHYELEKAEAEFNRYRWNMNYFQSKMRKLQEQIEKTLLK